MFEALFPSRNELIGFGQAYDGMVRFLTLPWDRKRLEREKKVAEAQLTDVAEVLDELNHLRKTVMHAHTHLKSAREDLLGARWKTKRMIKMRDKWRRKQMLGANLLKHVR